MALFWTKHGPNMVPIHTFFKDNRLSECQASDQGYYSEHFDGSKCVRFRTFLFNSEEAEIIK